MVKPGPEMGRYVDVGMEEKGGGGELTAPTGDVSEGMVPGSEKIGRERRTTAKGGQLTAEDERCNRAKRARCGQRPNEHRHTLGPDAVACPVMGKGRTEHHIRTK